MNIQWYPGHMTKAKRQMEEDIKLVDLVIELLDARVPLSSRNPDIDTMAKNKGRIIILNKADLADDAVTKSWKEYFENSGLLVITADARAAGTFRELSAAAQQACKEKIERDRKKGIKNRPLRAMVAGIPNVGKSTLINSYAGKAVAKTGNKPGVTKGKQWIRLGKNIELLDTPGILWPKFEDEAVGERLAMIGTINDHILSIEELAVSFIDFLKNNYPGALEVRYGADESAANAEILYAIGEKRGCRIKGNEISYEKAAQIVMDEFRGGKLGRISLEKPSN